MRSSELGRLFCVGIRGALPGEEVLERDLDACAEAGIGAIILFDVDLPSMRRFQAEGMAPEEAASRAPRNIRDPQQLRTLIRYLRDRLGDQVLVSIDQEGGRVARLSPRRGFPAHPSAAEFAQLGAGEQLSAAARQARQLAELGFDLNFAPCVDLAIASQSPIIAARERAFGKDPQPVVDCARMVIEAHAAEGIVPCLKHFPGHGSAAGDSHVGLVDITECWQRELELSPYRQLLDHPRLAVMVGHLLHRGVDARHPASLSAAMIQGMLRDELGFEGVVITDSIDMRAVLDLHTPGEAALAAIEAGADLVVDAFNLEERSEHPAPTLVGALDQALARETLPGGTARIERSLSRLDALRAS